MNNQKIGILTIGGSGLIGTQVNAILSRKYKINNLTLESGTDITQPNTLNNLSTDTKHQYVILYAAKANVDSCELDKKQGELGQAYRINVIGVQNVINAVKITNKKIIYISTDFVFDGLNTPLKGYSEEDTPNPVNWYGQTKYLGEKIVKNSGLPYIIIRIGYPLGGEFSAKTDFAHVFLFRLRKKQPLKAVTDHIITPTIIDDIGNALYKLISNDKQGIFHVSGSQSLSPYEAAITIAQKFDLDKSLITPVARSEFYKNRAPRPFNLKMNNDKIQKLGIKMRTFSEGLYLLL